MRNVMPVVQIIIPTQGREFWDSLDPNNSRQVLEAVKEEVKIKKAQARCARPNFHFKQFDRPEPAYELHYSQSGGTCTLPVWINLPCFRDCQVFLLRGQFIIKGQGRVTEPGYSYVVKDEAWIGLRGSTTLVFMEEGEQRGACLKWTQESRERILTKRQSPKKLKKSKSSSTENYTQCVPS